MSDLDTILSIFHLFLTGGMFYAMFRGHSSIRVILWGCSAMAVSQYLLARRVSMLEKAEEKVCECSDGR